MGTKIVLLDYAALAYIMFRQLCLRRFGVCPIFQLRTPIKILDCLAAAIEALNECPSQLQEKYSLLMSKNCLLAEYFSICIDDKGYLIGLPELLNGYRPLPEELPMFIWNLCLIPWENEYDCFDGVANQLGIFYSMLSRNSDVNSPREANHKMKSPEGRLSESGLHTLVYSILPAMKQLVVAKEDYEDMGFITQLASLEQLYKVFERC